MEVIKLGFHFDMIQTLDKIMLRNYHKSITIGTSLIYQVKLLLYYVTTLEEESAKNSEKFTRNA